MAGLTHRVVGFGGRVAVLVTATSSVRIKVGTDAAVTAGVIFSPAVTPDASGYAKCTVAGLTPGVRYYYRVAMTDSTSGVESLDTSAVVGRIQVAPTGPTSFTFDFGSCTDSSTGGWVATTDSASMASIAARNDNFFLHLGDLFYDDAAAPSVANYQSRIGSRFAVANHARVFATMPSDFIPSDHDFTFANNGTGLTDTTARTQYNQVYRQMMPMTPDAAAGTTGIYHTFVWGRVRFLMLDCRSFQTSPNTVDSATKTMLGTTQKNWFKTTIQNATEPVIVIAGDTAWTGAYDPALPNDDSWAGCPTERQELATFLSTQTTKRFVYIGGDMHALAANNGSGTGLGLPSYAASPLNNDSSIKGGDWTSGPYPATDGTAIISQYGRVVVTDTGTTISLAFTGYTSDNVSRVTQTNTFPVSGTTTAVSASRASTWRTQARTTSAKSTNWQVLAGGGTISVTFSTRAIWNVAAAPAPTTRVTGSRLATWTTFAAQGSIAVETWNGAAGAPWPAQWTASTAATPAPPTSGAAVGAATINGAQQGQISTSAAAFAVGPTEVLTGMPLTRDAELVVDVGLDTYTADGYVGVNLRSGSTLRGTSDYVTANGYYWALINEPVAGIGGAWEVGRVVDGVKTVLQRTPYTYTGRVRVRLQLLGASVAVRVWNVGAAEPTVWGYTGTDPAPYLPDGRLMLAVQSGAAAASRVAAFENLTLAPVTLGRVNTARVTTWNANAVPQQFFYGGYTVGYGAPTDQAIETVGTPTLYENSVATQAVVPVPAGTVVGELLVAAVSQASGAPIGTPIAWTMLGHVEASGASLAVFGRFATGSEPASYIFPLAAENGPVSGAMTRVTGVTQAMLDVPPITATTAGPSTVGLALPSLSTVSVNTLLLSAYSIATTNAALPVPPVSMTTVVSTTGLGQSTAIAAEYWQPSGPTDVRRWGMNPATAAFQQVGLLVALRSASTALVPVTGTRTGTWRSLARASETRQSRWTVSAGVGVTLVTREARASWDIVSATVLNQVSTAAASSWRVQARVVSSRDGSWSLFSQQQAGAPLTARPNMRLRVYAPYGADLGPLPAPQSASVGYPLNDVGSISLSYAAKAPRSSLLGQPCEIAVEVSPDSGVNWIEPPDSRFVYLSDGMDPRAVVRTYDVEARSLIWVLTKAKVLPNGQVDSEGRRSFLSNTPGAILKTLFAEAQARGAMSGLTHASFTASADSSGAPWANKITIYYEPSTDYLAVLRNMADQGFIDFRMQGRSIEVYNADTVLARDRTVGAGQVKFLPGRDITEAPFRRTWEGLANYAFFIGDNTTYEATNPAAITPWGRWETVISNGSVTDPGTMAALTQAELSQTDRERVEYTCGLDFTRAFSRPFWDYRVGDYVWRTVDGVTQDRLRVYQLTLSTNEQGIVTGNAVLNDRFLEADVRAKRRVDGITNGAAGPGGGTVPGDPGTDPTGPDKLAPAKVAGLIGSSAAFMGPGGFPQAQVTLTWGAVTANSDGTPLLDLSHYELYQRPAGTDVFTRVLATATPELSHTMSPYITGSNWVFSVRAVDTNGNRGLFSNEVTVGMARDTIPPQAPSSPTVDDYLGSLMVRWDGNPVTGQWPGDFDYVQVHASTVNNFTPTVATQVGRLYGRGDTSLTNVAYGVPVYVRLVAVDTSRLESVPSAQATGTPHRLVGSDLDPDAITFEQLAFKDPDNLVADGSFESPTYRARLAARSDARWVFTTVNSRHGDYSASIDTAQGAGTVRVLDLQPIAEAQQILATDKLFTRYAFNAAAGANGTVQLVVEWRLADGTTQRSVLPAVLRNGTWQQVAAQQTAPPGVETFRVYLEVGADATLGVWYIDTVEVRRTIGTALIQDAAIKRAQIDDLAVNSAKIADLSVAKLTAGTLNAAILLGNQITTATSGARVEMTPTGIRLYNSAGEVKAHLDPSVGQLRTYSTSDVTHTSNTHGFQIGYDNDKNLALDNNEIMARVNGTYGALFINREGGPILLGGKVGGFNPDTSDTGVFPADENHSVTVRASLRIHNVSDGDYGEEFPPLLIGRPGAAHLWFDNNEVGATAATGDAVGTLFLQHSRGPGNHHNESVVLASGSLGVRRWGDYAGSGTRSVLLYGYDGTNNTGLRFSGNSDKLFVTDRDGAAAKPIGASSFDVSSSRTVKHSIAPIDDPLAKIRQAPASRWKYVSAIEEADVWHVGPMWEDLPDEVKSPASDPTSEHAVEQVGSTSLPSMVGLLWEAVRHLADKIEDLEARRADQR